MTRYKHSSHSNDARIAGLGQVPFIVNRPGNQRRDIAEFQMQLMVEFADHQRCPLLDFGRSMTLGAHFHLRQIIVLRLRAGGNTGVATSTLRHNL